MHIAIPKSDRENSSPTQGTCSHAHEFSSFNSNNCCPQSYSSNHSTISRICIMGAKKRNNPGLTIRITPPDTNMTVKQYRVAGEDLQRRLRSFDDAVARALEQEGKEKLVQLDHKDGY